MKHRYFVNRRAFHNRRNEFYTYSRIELWHYARQFQPDVERKQRKYVFYNSSRWGLFLESRFQKMVPLFTHLINTFKVTFSLTSSILKEFQILHIFKTLLTLFWNTSRFPRSGYWKYLLFCQFLSLNGHELCLEWSIFFKNQLTLYFFTFNNPTRLCVCPQPSFQEGTIQESN